MSSIETSAHIVEAPELDGQRSSVIGRQRVIKHVYTPDRGPAITWEHAEPFHVNCDACRANVTDIGEKAYFDLLASEAPLD